MRRIPTFAILGALAAIAGATFFDAPAANAQFGNARWCANVHIGLGDWSESCDFATIEACQPFVIAGNRGFCNENPRYVEPGARHPRKKRHVKG